MGKDFKISNIAFKSRKKSFEIVGCIVFLALIFLYCAGEEKEKLAAISIFGTGLAALAGAFAAFDFDKRESERNKIKEDQKNFIFLAEYFESEVEAFYLDIETIHSNAEKDTITPVPKRNSNFDLNIKDAKFILDYDRETFKNASKAIRYLEIYYFNAAKVNAQLKTYSLSGIDKEEFIEDIKCSMNSIYNGAKIGIRLLNETLHCLSKFGEIHLQTNLDLNNSEPSSIK